MKKMVEHTYCDKCGKEMEELEGLMLKARSRKISSMEGGAFDLCSKCYRLVETFIKTMQDSEEPEVTEVQVEEAVEVTQESTGPRSYDEEDYIQFVDYFESGKTQRQIMMLMNLTLGQVQYLGIKARKDGFKRGIKREMGNPELKNVERKERTTVVVDKNGFVM